jgi:hypothetical protein
MSNVIASDNSRRKSVKSIEIVTEIRPMNHLSL